MLSQYPGNLGHLLHDILTFGAQIGYTGPEAFILSKNLSTAVLAPSVIENKLYADLQSKRVLPVNPSLPFISSPLGLVPKHDGGWRRIHHLSYPPGRSVNFHISEESATLQYVKLSEILDDIVAAGRGCLLVKRDIKDAFRNVPVAPHNQWLLGFEWNGQHYKEAALPFGLATAPFLFNLFAEGLHWILATFLCWQRLHHYLDDFIVVFSGQASQHKPILAQASADYIHITNALGVPRNDTKDAAGTVVQILGVEVDSKRFEARLPKEKVDKAIQAASAALADNSISLRDAQSLAGFLSFCSRVVRLGKVMLRELWTFLSLYPPTSKPFTRRRVPTAVREDLTWWTALLPAFNGVLFFDDANRVTFSLYTDASLQGLGGFYFKGAGHWTDNTHRISSSQAFCRNGFSQHINVEELSAILIAFELWGRIWQHSRVIIHTDSTTAYSALTSQSVRGDGLATLRQILLKAAEFDVVFDTNWLRSEDNGLADALSRFKFDSIADACPHWQILSLSSLLLPSSPRPPHPPTNTPSCSGAAWATIPEPPTALRRSPTKPSASLTRSTRGPRQKSP